MPLPVRAPNQQSAQMSPLDSRPSAIPATSRQIPDYREPDIVPYEQWRESIIGQYRGQKVRRRDADRMRMSILQAASPQAYDEYRRGQSQDALRRSQFDLDRSQLQFNVDRWGMENQPNTSEDNYRQSQAELNRARIKEIQAGLNPTEPPPSTMEGLRVQAIRDAMSPESPGSTSITDDEKATIGQLQDWAYAPRGSGGNIPPATQAFLDRRGIPEYQGAAAAYVGLQSELNQPPDPREKEIRQLQDTANFYQKKADEIARLEDGDRELEARYANKADVAIRKAEILRNEITSGTMPGVGGNPASNGQSVLSSVGAMPQQSGQRYADDDMVRFRTDDGRTGSAPYGKIKDLLGNGLNLAE
jgi:hypothetical protein